MFCDVYFEKWSNPTEQERGVKLENIWLSFQALEHPDFVQNAVKFLVFLEFWRMCSKRISSTVG